MRYAITDRSLFGTSWPGQREGLLRQAARLATEGVEYLQLREKDLPAGTLAQLTRDLLAILRGSPTRLLLNSRVDVALATGAPGVHLTSHPDELTPQQVRHLYAAAGLPAPLLTLSCHNLRAIRRHREDRLTAILFGAVFGKTVAGQTITPATGLDALRAACAAASPTPVLALGGITPETVPACLAAGAAGVGGIRLFC